MAFPSTISYLTKELVSCPERCDYLVQQIRKHCSQFAQYGFPAVGFDCEWAPGKEGTRGKVALLTLVSPQGLCVLLQLHRFRTMPPGLLQLLKDLSIWKVGMKAGPNGIKLRDDYNIVRGTLSLGKLASSLGMPLPFGIVALARKVLGRVIDKDWRLEASNWENYNLSTAQIEYAVQDATIALDIFHELCQSSGLSPGLLNNYRDQDCYDL